jgi:transcriptional regulator with XRE-family HTH domain
MRERIRQIMEHENLTPAKFADKLQISRAVISHILNGRNNPSLDVVTKILTQMDYINPEWLLIHEDRRRFLQHRWVHILVPIKR